MSGGRLPFAKLMVGGLDQLLRRPVAAGLFVAAQAAAGHSMGLAEGLGTSSAFLVFVLAVLTSQIASLFMMALGGNLRQIASDPVGLFIRLMFAFAVTLVVTAGSAIGAIFLVIPGLYIAARWMLAEPLVLLDGCGIMEALERSWRLTGSAAWSLVGVVAVSAVPALLFVVLETTTSAPAVLLQDLLGACLAAYSIALVVHAHSELSDRVKPLAETFT